MAGHAGEEDFLCRVCVLLHDHVSHGACQAVHLSSGWMCWCHHEGRIRTKVKAFHQIHQACMVKAFSVACSQLE